MSQAAKQITGRFLHILKIGHQRLLTPTKLVDPQASHIKPLIEQMLYTFRYSPELNSRLGIAANQFDLDLPIDQTPRLFLARLEEKSPHPRYDSIWSQNKFILPLSVIINPKITPTTNEKTLGFEPCASLPGIKAAVSRWQKINCTYLDENGNNQSLDLEGVAARLFQHETDHLDGILASQKAEYIVNDARDGLICDHNHIETDFVNYIMGEGKFNPDFFVGS